MVKREEPLVAGESARLILDTLRGFPLTVEGAGRVVLHDSATGEARAALDRAYERTEMALMMEQAQCSHPEEHRTLGEDDFRDLVLFALACGAKDALGEQDHLDPLWMPPLTGPPPLPPAAWPRFRGGAR